MPSQTAFNIYCLVICFISLLTGVYVANGLLNSSLRALAPSFTVNQAIFRAPIDKKQTMQRQRGNRNMQRQQSRPQQQQPKPVAAKPAEKSVAVAASQTTAAKPATNVKKPQANAKRVMKRPLTPREMMIKRALREESNRGWLGVVRNLFALVLLVPLFLWHWRAYRNQKI